MGNFIRNRLAHGVTVVSNEFIDNYMARANGEYVKVYLYILRNGGRADSVADIADALNHTEADVRRALVYWEQAADRSAALRRESAIKRLTRWQKLELIQNSPISAPEPPVFLQ